MYQPTDDDGSAHLTLCVAQVLDAVITGMESGDTSHFNVDAATDLIARPCVHHIEAALYLLSGAYRTARLTPSMLYECAPVVIAGFWAGGD